MHCRSLIPLNHAVFFCYPVCVNHFSVRCLRKHFHDYLEIGEISDLRKPEIVTLVSRKNPVKCRPTGRASLVLKALEQTLLFDKVIINSAEGSYELAFHLQPSSPDAVLYLAISNISILGTRSKTV